MRNVKHLAAVLAGSILISACTTSSKVYPSPPPPPRDPAPVTSTPATRPPPPAVSFPDAQVMNVPGLESVIMASSRSLAVQFGTPQLDVREGDMRKLQFAGSACVLDIFLYPPREGGELRATWVEARRASDGAAVDRAACVAALKR